MNDTPDRILRLPAVLTMTGLSRSTLYCRVAAKSFPPPVKIAQRCTGWRLSALNEWMRNPMFYEAA